MDRINLGERLFQSLISEDSARLLVALVDEGYWVSLVRYRGGGKPQQNAKDVFGIVLDGAIEARAGETGFSLERGEAFLAKGGEAWSVIAEEGATVLQFECRRQGARGDSETKTLNVM